MNSTISRALAVAVLTILTGCGGDAASPPAAPVTPPPVKPLPGFLNQWNLCQTPRPGLNANNLPYPDRQGTLADEQQFLRGWIDEAYLWYKEVPDNFLPGDFSSAIDYFNVLKTPALTASGTPKDKYHFTYPSERWEALSARGLELGYGVSWYRNSGAPLPRTWFAATVEPGSPSDAGGLRRGDQLLAVDGADFVNGGDSATVALLNAGLFPQHEGELHRLRVSRKGVVVNIAVSAARVAIVPVKYARTIDTPTGKVGYLSFGSHNAVSELQLIEAIGQFKEQGVTDLILDVRYNGGGLLYVASELAYMIAGPAATSGKIFEQAQYNDKRGEATVIPFRSSAYGFAAPLPARAGQSLPYLGLQRVTLLTTPGTCSASESIVNSLRGVDLEVNLIGARTCGKPYAFTPTPNCGTTYFAIEFQGVNDKGFGDYADGFAPTCSVPDDLSRAIGDPAEGMLAVALSYRANNACPAPAAAQRAKSVGLQLVRPPVEEISIYSPPR